MWCTFRTSVRLPLAYKIHAKFQSFTLFDSRKLWVGISFIVSVSDFSVNFSINFWKRFFALQF